MAETGGLDWSEGRRATLRALCDTYVAPVEPPAVEHHDPTGFWARAASDLGTPGRVAGYLDERLTPDDRAGMLELLDALRAIGFAHLPQRAREATIRTLRRVSASAAAGLDGYRGITLADFYGHAGAGGTNPNWEQLGYPGPPAVGASFEPAVRTFEPDPGAAALDLSADVVVIGSGSGGGVVAGELAGAGLDVVVLEAGGHHGEADFPRDELSALRELYWRGGVTATADGNVAMLAGATLGGGSTINWMNCVLPPDHVRREWAHAHGLEGVDGRDFDEHLDAVLRRISATDEATDLNPPNRRLADGAQALGWAWHRARRNADLATYDPATAGHVGFGDRTGSKQGTLRTYLVDAAEAGARILVRCRAERLLVEGGRVAGAAAVLRHDGRALPVTVRARDVVVAAGALETPALLLRSGIGGPAVGHHLRLHPVPNIPGFYPEPQRAWWGPPQATIVDEHADVGDGHGFLVETPHLHVGIAAATVPWRSAREHKLIVGRSAHLATFLAVNREHGSGRVSVDERGEAVVTYPLDHPADRDLIRRSVVALVRLHEAAGAEAIVDLQPALAVWRRGQDIGAFAARARGGRLGAGGRTLFSAHQMGSARMGSDPGTSVADPDGQVHDTAGVWIADTSAFPSAVGSNPMITCMALARRTAHALLAAR